MDDVKKDISGTLDGRVEIKIRFTNRVMWQRYRKYILRTAWDFHELEYPRFAKLEQEFHNFDDVERITKQIVYLLQMGFDIYSAKWNLTENQKERDAELSRDLTDLWEQSYEEMEEF